MIIEQKEEIAAMSKEELILTAEGLKKIEDELEELKTVKRKELAQRLKVAISYGDLKENSEYHSAKDDQAFMETRILQLERMLKIARVVDAGSIALDKVGVGSIVTLNDIEFNEKIDYQVVGPAEADVADNKISYESPLGQELMGKKVGDIINVNAPVGIIRYELLEIKVY
ncbi:transcription elongation factor GreA [Paenibacillus agaridevorans]|uniref:Transcription elongation factor GreA n=2 Tax=Paenibacillus agaridevorans TaxID=171404 RepID=A0A2R5EL97_9BACL|nr:transcription elongation factor GreA [Paenibacillus agaridevorans]